MSTARSRFLVSYDISDAKRLRHVHKTIKDFGWPMQYSVFICDLDAVEMLLLKQRMSEIIHHDQDSVAFIHLGPPSHRGRECFDFMGVRTPLPTSGPTII